ncbi:MAG: outer membrane lipoprotein LolB [Rhodocyclaceae bacterium]|nr:outer membrane lipoprotein LolB [Rhodocyclaceae bacterium]
MTGAVSPAAAPALRPSRGHAGRRARGGVGSAAGRVASLAALVLLAACASAPRAPAGAAARAEAPAFNFNGRLLASDGNRRFNANLRWMHADTSRIFVTTPLGQAVAAIDVDADGARLSTADGRQFRAGSLSELARRGLGLTLPLEHLTWWLSGRAAPDVPAEATTEGGFAQRGWTVRYGARDETGRPLRLDAECGAPCPDAGAAAGAALSVRLIIDQWLDP